MGQFLNGEEKLARAAWPLMPPPPAPRNRRTSVAARSVYLRTADAGGLYRQFVFVAADDTVKQGPRPNP
jgi:hypothetical protein